MADNMWNNQGKEQSQMWSTHDLACAHCRARKIRCGRERPQCESCKRDGVECRYSSPGKRINHVKLLCQNFEALEDQLNTIQGDLSALTSLVKNGSVGRALPAQGEEWTLEDTTNTESSPVTRRDRHIVRNETHSVDRYHGPCSLYTLCKEFHDSPVFQSPEPNTVTGNDSILRMLLQEMCAEASKEDHMDIASEHVGICLPPRQFLNMVVDQFFRNADYTTDIFVRSNFQKHLDRVYSHPLAPNDEAWAVCFNVIVLLALGKDKATTSNDPFLQPFVQTLRMAVNNPRVSMAPRLVNVQALALLSHAAERYSPPGFCEIVFAQACLLAKTMGLHQSRAASDGHTTEEAIEKHKVFRSLYIRDKNLAICRGSSSWLPSYDSTISPLSDEVGSDEDKYAPRIELARIQDEVYRHFYSAEAPELSSSKHLHLLSRLEQKLERWESTHHMTKMSISSVASVNMMLSFYATRICVFRGSDEPRVLHQAFKDAKACCILLLLASTSQPDTRLMGVLDQLVGRDRSPSPDDHAASGSDTSQGRHDDDDTAWALPKLSANFPLAAFFLVAKSVVRPMTAEDDMFSRTEEEMGLLETLRDRYVNTTDHDCTQNFTRKISRTLDSLVHIVRQKRYPEAANTPSMVFNDLSSLHSSTSSQRGSSRKNTPPGPEYPAYTDALPDNSSLLLPFMQPLGASTMSSPPHSSPQRQGSTGGLVTQWPSTPYKQQSDPAVGRVGKRPRLSSQTDLFDMTVAFADHGHGHDHDHGHGHSHGPRRPDEDPLTMFEFLAASNDISVFDTDE